MPNPRVRPVVPAPRVPSAVRVLSSLALALTASLLPAVPVAAAVPVTVPVTVPGEVPGERAASGNEVLYVAPTSTGPEQGTLAAPYTSFAEALDALGPEGGTVVARGGTYAQQRIILDHRRNVTIRAYPGETPVLDATGLTPPTGSSGLVEIRGGRDLTVQGLEITGYRTAEQDTVPIGIYAIGAPRRLRIAGNHVHHLGNDNPERGSFDINAHGIAVYGTNPDRPARGLRITGNEVNDLVLGASESVVVNGNVAGWKIARNHIHHNNNIGIDAIGYESTLTGADRWTNANRARRGVIARNLVTDIVSRGNPAYWESPGWCNCADGIYVDGGKDITIRDNVVTRADIGIEAASEWPRGGTEDIRIRRNLVTESAYTGLAIGGYGAKRGEASQIVVARNTLRGNNTLDDGSPEVLLQFKVHDTRIVRNKITATNPDSPYLIQRVRRAGTPAQNANVRLDHNDYGVPGAIRRAAFSDGGAELTGLPAWQRRTGQDRHSTISRR